MEDMAPTNSPEGEGACRIEALLGSLGVYKFGSLDNTKGNHTSQFSTLSSQLIR